MLSPRWRKVFRDLWDNKSRTILVVLSIAVGVIAFGGLFATRTNVIDNLEIQFEEGNAPDMVITIRAFDEDLVRWVARQPGVIQADGVADHIQEAVVDDEVFDISLKGVEHLDDISINRVSWEAGQFDPERGQILIERSYMDMIGLSMGDTLNIRDDDDRIYPLQIVGIVHDINVQPGFIDPVVKGYVSTRTLYRLGLSSEYNTLSLRIDRDNIPDLNAFAQDLQDDLERRGVEVRTVTIFEVRQHWSTDNLNGIITILIIVGGFSLVLSGFLVINTISGFLAQQKKQIGIMKIIGAGNMQIFALYVAMAAAFGVVAMFIAIPASSMLARALATMLGPNTLNFDIDVFRLPIFIILIEVTVALLGPIISALAPIINGVRVPPAQAISDYNITTSNNPIDILLSKISGLPTPLIIPIRNTFRRKLRLLMTLITLVIAGGFFIAILNVRAAVQVDVQSLVQMNDFDVQAILSENYNRQGIERRAEEIAGVLSVEGWLSSSAARVRPNGVESEALIMNGVQQDSVFIDPDLKEGRWLDPPTSGNQYDLVIGHQLLENEPDLAVGSTITLTVDGDEQDWNIVGIVWNTSPENAPQEVYGYYDSVSRFVGKPELINSVLIRTVTRDLETQLAVEKGIINSFDNFGIDISTTLVLTEFINELLDTFDVIIYLMLITAVMVAIVGGLGLAGTMSLSVLERTREIGVMRSVGATNHTLRLMFISEGVVIGMISFIISLAISYPFTAAFATVLGETIRDRSWSIILSISGPIAWLLIILVVSAVASVLPAQRAAQISIREALSYE